MKKNDRIDSCGIFLGIVLIAVATFIIYEIVLFFKKPDTISQIINFIVVIGGCIGAFIAFIIVVYLLDSLFSAIRNRFRRKSKIFPGRAYIKLMVPIDYGPVPEDLPDAPNQISSFPISVNLSMTNYGLWITASNSKEFETPSNSNKENISRDFFDRFNNSIIIPISHINLFYKVYRRKDSLEFELGPSKAHGFKDRIPKVPHDNFLKIIIIFTHILKRVDLRESIILEQPIKMELIVQKIDGEDDLLATARLYILIYDKKKEIEVQDDDSWMYRSRPMYW